MQNLTVVSRMRWIFLWMFSSWLAVGLTVPGKAQMRPAQNVVGPITDAMRNRDFQTALNLCQAALASRASDYRIWTLRGMALAESGNLPLATQAYEHALRLAPGFLPALEGAAQSEFQLGRSDASVFLLKVLAQRPDDPLSHAYLGILDYRNKNCADAVNHFERAEPVVRNRPEILNEYGYCLATLGRDEEAASIFAQVEELDPTSQDARYNLALAQWKAHHPDEALTALQPLLDSTLAREDVLTLAADIYESKNDTLHAVELLRKALAANPTDLNTYMQFATLSYDHASPQVGVDILDFGLRQLPNQPRLYLVRGILLTQMGKFSQAAEDFATAGQIDPKLSFLGVAEGLIQSQQHHSAEALASFRSAAKAHPQEAYAQYLLAEALAEKGPSAGSPEYAEEVAAASRAVKLDPHLVAARDLLDDIYIESGQLDEAIKQSRAALSIDPNDQQAVYHLILALRKTNQKDQVPALLQRLLQLRANNSRDKAENKRFLLSDDMQAVNLNPR